MHELASDLPCECVHFLVVRLRRSVLVDAVRHAERSRAGSSSTSRRSDARVPPAPPHAADVSTRPVRRGPQRRWLLKSPGHLQTLPQVFAEYPDASVIHTHRDPRRFIASLVSLLSVLRFMRSDRVDVAALGPMMELTYQMFLEQVIAERERRHRSRTTASSTATSST